MAKINRWWVDNPREKLWLEVTRRDDIGANLKAPQANEQGEDYWSYSLIHEIEEGDLVYHYDGVAQAITARSVATGIVWTQDVVWAARGSSARSANIAPHSRPGWYLGLESFERLPTPITLDSIRNQADAVRSLTASLRLEFGEPLYFPFEISDRRPIRPMQGYLFKLPSGFRELFGVPPTPLPMPAIMSSSHQGLGDDYRTADEILTIPRVDPFAVDPALVERGVRGHAVTQNALAGYVRSLGLEPRSPRPGEPNFDVAWQCGSRIFVAEVKSLTIRNEEKQLRLGLGQVLRYADQLRTDVRAVPVLAVERCPTDSSWEQLCNNLGVMLVWPEAFAQRLS
jgi:hypothetical protein